MSASAADFDPARYPDLDPIKYRRLIAMLDDAIGDGGARQCGNARVLAPVGPATAERRVGCAGGQATERRTAMTNLSRLLLGIIEDATQALKALEARDVATLESKPSSPVAKQSRRRQQANVIELRPEAR